jgi:hypothetical protein
MSRIVPKYVALIIQERARFLCEYCKLPDSLGFANFEVDHIIARAHGGGSLLDNLAWSCLYCNLNKGSNLSSVDPKTGKIANLFHPRRNRWSLHFHLSEGLIIPQTAAARATLSLLKMNLPQTFILRRAIEQLDSTYAQRVVQRCV